MNRFPLVVLLVVMAIIVAVAWTPARRYVGLLSPWPSPTPAASPSPSTLPPLAVAETETKTVEARDQEPPAAEPTAPASTPGAEQPRYKCRDGSALTITSADANQVNYRCASGAVGHYLN
jgi:hypothetical protein